MAKTGKAKRPQQPKHAAKPTDPAERILAAAMEVAVRIGWRRAALADIAAAAGMRLGEVHAHFADKGAMLRGIVELADRRVLAGAGEPDPESSARDRLFDVLMRRFDALAQHRAGVLACWHGISADPVALACRFPAALASMRWMLEAAGIPANGPLGMLRAKGLLAVWVAVFRTWETDETADFSATMAALDKALTRAESLAETLEPLLGGRKRPESGPPPAAGTEPGSPLGAGSEPDAVD
jgi:AcrR family transcriptional regulator